jgi:hypothetical protein
MATEGIDQVFMETHNREKAARCFQSLGYELELETGHSSAQLRPAPQRCRPDAVHR